ncbi:hypothetical protein [Pseudanabaena sp. PCC 6802]|uniref:hypothetical protein n=1 Tax=Pseudanabaena sp. PCC 6802 TaxID=118173 RepID=UPI00034BC188|nr:hypothetical protein [Pseudanabaena sp. PCC 6802]
MPLSVSLAERLTIERSRRFVGRKFELYLFQTAILKSKSADSPQLPFHVLHVFGPGGVGKTSLLEQFCRICEQHQIRSLYIDTRNIEPTPESFLSSLRTILGLEPTDSPLQAFADRSDCLIILLDTYETLEPLDDWIRETFLPQLTENVLVVIASRHAPAPAWRSDSGWQSLVRVVPLRNLSPEESQAYLTKRDVPELQHQSVLEFTHGHPLALSLVADVFEQGHDIQFQTDVEPDIVKILLERFVQDLPSSDRRMALEACALVRVTTEALLSRMLELLDVHKLFNWLRSLSFVESGQQGIFPHDVVREVLIADLRWRNPDWYVELHRRARSYYTQRLQETQGQQQHRLLFDYIFLHRDNPAVRPRFTWQENKSLQTDTMRESDVPALIRMVEQHEGRESASIAAHWLARQPHSVMVFRDAQPQLAGFVMAIALHQASESDLRADPAAIAAWEYLHKHAPLRSGEGASLFRFWMARDTYQNVSPTQSLIFINLVQYYRNTSGLAFTFLPCADPESWAAMFAYADLTRLPEADFTVGGKCYGAYGHDWRVLSPAAWQELLAQREIAASVQATNTTHVSEPLLVLSQAEFVEAVQHALRHLSSPNILQQNPLLRSRLIVEHTVDKTDMNQRIATLQSAIEEIIASLRSAPRDEKLYRALDRTYLHPAPTQERAAELLDLPFSTYRRHLKTGIERVTNMLWQREIS